MLFCDFIYVRDFYWNNYLLRFVIAFESNPAYFFFTFMESFLEIITSHVLI